MKTVQYIVLATCRQVNLELEQKLLLSSIYSSDVGFKGFQSLYLHVIA